LATRNIWWVLGSYWHPLRWRQAMQAHLALLVRSAALPPGMLSRIFSLNRLHPTPMLPDVLIDFCSNAKGRSRTPQSQKLALRKQATSQAYRKASRAAQARAEQDNGRGAPAGFGRPAGGGTAPSGYTGINLTVQLPCTPTRHCTAVASVCSMGPWPFNHRVTHQRWPRLRCRCSGVGALSRVQPANCSGWDRGCAPAAACTAQAALHGWNSGWWGCQCCQLGRRRGWAGQRPKGVGSA
jgi:hypothetical protein